jgi:hypothetical protein
MRTPDTLGAGTAGGGWLDCARLVAAETPDAVATKDRAAEKRSYAWSHELIARPRSEPQHRRERIMQASRSRLQYTLDQWVGPAATSNL